jgi:hypothetical protein
MKMKCLACGTEKDTVAKETYPFPDDGIDNHSPITPLFAVDCCGRDWRVAIVCHQCMHRLEPDHWISDSMWAALHPVIPFEALPFPAEERTARFDVEAYA